MFAVWPIQALSVLSASKQPVREAWATWNPQRAAAKELQHQIEQGTLTLEVRALPAVRHHECSTAGAVLGW
jgi:hypothetical protein